MKTFKSYLQESDSEVRASAEEAFDHMHRHCGESLWMLSKSPLWRGFGESSAQNTAATNARINGWVSADAPTNRHSANTSNFYTAFIDSNPSRGGYPKRSSSWICSTDYDTAFGFGIGQPFAIIPFDGAKIGVCYGSDLWNAKIALIPEQTKPHRISNYNTFWVDMLADMKTAKCTRLAVKDIDDTTIGQFMHDLSKFISTDEGALNLWQNLIMHSIDPYIGPYDAGKTKNVAANFIKHVWDAYSPNTLGFDLVNASSLQKYIKGDHEVWTDSKVMIIRHDVWKEMQELNK